MKNRQLRRREKQLKRAADWLRFKDAVALKKDNCSGSWQTKYSEKIFDYALSSVPAVIDGGNYISD